MKTFAVLVSGLALGVGVGGGLLAYAAASQAGPPLPTAQVGSPSTGRHAPPAQVVRPGLVLAWAPCVKPAVRVGRACVTHVIREVSLPTTASSGPTPAAPPSSSAPAHPSSGSHPGRHSSTDGSDTSDTSDDTGSDDTGDDHGSDDSGSDDGTHQGGGDDGPGGGDD